MKRALVVACFAALMLMAFTSSAFALHGAYNSTGASCGECHSVHEANGGGAGTQGQAGQALFIVAPDVSTPGAYQQNTGTGGSGIAPSAGFANSNTEHLCEYCHVYGGHVIDQVYGAGLQGNANTMAAHKIGETAIPNSSAGAGFLKGDGAGGLGCVDCHNALPHAAKSGKDWSGSSQVLNMTDPAGKSKAMYTQWQGVDLAPYGGQKLNAFCARCHDQNMALSLGGTTHVLTTQTVMPTTNYGTVKVAWNGSETCAKCHNVREFHALQAVAGQTILDATTPTSTIAASIVGTKPFQRSTIEATGSAFTAFGPGIDRNYVATPEIADGICLSCHMDPSADATTNPTAGGVGQSF